MQIPVSNECTLEARQITTILQLLTLMHAKIHVHEHQKLPFYGNVCSSHIKAILIAGLGGENAKAVSLFSGCGGSDAGLSKLVSTSLWQTIFCHMRERFISQTYQKQIT